MAWHDELEGDDAIHEIMYVQSPDPGAVGANKFWLDTTGGATLTAGAILKQRSSDNTSWTTRADIKTALDLKAALASPAFTGTPTAPTAVTGTDTTQLATTEFVQQEIASLTPGGIGGAPDDATYLTLGANGSLSNERVLTLAGRLSGADAGAWSTYTLDVTNNMRDAALAAVIGDGVNVITTGFKGFLEVPFSGTIVAVRLFADAAGSIVIDIWKDTYANFPPTAADTITASAKPTLASAQKAQDTTLTGWGTSVAAGDVLGFNVDSVATLKQVTLSLTIRRS